MQDGIEFWSREIGALSCLMPNRLVDLPVEGDLHDDEVCAAAARAIEVESLGVDAVFAEDAADFGADAHVQACPCGLPLANTRGGYWLKFHGMSHGFWGIAALLKCLDGLYGLWIVLDKGDLFKHNARLTADLYCVWLGFSRCDRKFFGIGEIEVFDR